MDERARIWEAKGRQRLTEKEWYKVFRSQFGDLAIYMENRERVGFPRSYFRKQVLQLTAACLESLENSDFW